MPIATDQQVQTYFDERIRPWCEKLRALLLEGQDHKAAIDDVYAALSQQAPTWADNRTDGPPHLATVSDGLAFNAYVTALIPHIKDAEGFAIMMSLCVRPVSV